MARFPVSLSGLTLRVLARSAEGTFKGLASRRRPGPSRQAKLNRELCS